MTLILGILIAAALGPILTGAAMTMLLIIFALAMLPPVEPTERVTLSSTSLKGSSHAHRFQGDRGVHLPEPHPLR